MTSRLVVVSNRLAVVREGESPVGGLAVAVHAALKDQGGIWFGRSGETVATPSSAATITHDDHMTYATIDLTRREHNEYYSGFANSVLWPLFHYRMGLVDYRRDDFDSYFRVNQRFARGLLPLLQPDDTIWVHDYHLIPLGQELRREGVTQKIGFFLHTPFPAEELAAILPRHAQLFRPMLAYDLVGFQTEGDRSAFLHYMQSEIGAEIGSDGTVQTPSRTTQTGVFPIGIETSEIVAAGQKVKSSPKIRRIRREISDRTMIIGVDRLDYSKGLVERFRAFERLLDVYPDERNRVTLMQIAPPSRTNVRSYRQIRRELESAASEINGRLADFDWVPIRYINRSYGQDDLVAFYRSSPIGLVTPLRDGMNLVAKEYVAAQDPENPGVLVLSRFAGAARELTGALIVNPFDTDEVAEAIRIALHMPLEDRVRRWKGMMERLRRQDVHAWRRQFLDALAATAT